MMQTVTITQATVEQGRATAWNKQGNRTWEAEWHTDQRVDTDGDKGHRVVTLTASHRSGQYRVTAGIATRIEDSATGFTVTQHQLFRDPFATLYSADGRFSQKRLKEIFDQVYQEFDAKAFYADREVER